MKYTKIIPSDEKVLTSPESGVKFSFRDVTMVSSMVNNCSSLIKFGEEIYNKYKESGYLLMNYEAKDKGKGFIAYEIVDVINVIEIYSQCINKKEDKICYEALIESVYNISKSTGKTLVVNSDDKDVKYFIDDMNQKYKEQKIEDKYWWKTE